MSGINHNRPQFKVQGRETEFVIVPKKWRKKRRRPFVMMSKSILRERTAIAVAQFLNNGGTIRRG